MSHAIVLSSVAILANPAALSFPLEPVEQKFLLTAKKLFDLEVFDHALLDVWNAAVHNLRRRVEAYSVELFESVVKPEPGRKTYKADGESMTERWAGVDDAVLLTGAQRLGLISKKAHRALETINWMRNHGSAAHGSDDCVGGTDVVALAMLLQENLFSQPLPDPGHSVATIFEPVRKQALDNTRIDVLKDQIRSYTAKDLRTCFQFLLDLYLEGNEPATSNVRHLLPMVWEMSSDELKKVAGARFHALTLTPGSDTSVDQRARARLLDLLVEVHGIRFVPEGSRALVYRQAGAKLAAAKNKSYGWSDEQVTAEALAQLGPYVPSIAFEEVYQEIAAVWCGNFWGRSSAHGSLKPFVESLTPDKLLQLVSFFKTNSRVKAELDNSKPKAHALALLTHIKSMLALATHIAEVDSAIAHVQSL